MIASKNWGKCACGCGQTIVPESIFSISKGEFFLSPHEPARGSDGELGTDSPRFTPAKNRRMAWYQKKMFKYCCGIQYPALFCEMRTRKTLVTIRSLKIRNCKSILIVSSYGALLSWEDELTTENENFVTLYGTKKSRQKILNSIDRDRRIYYLMSKEGHLVTPEIGKLKWDAVVVDESTSLKAPPAKITKIKMNRSLYYETYFRDVPNRFILTGTPNPESELNYYMQLAFLDPSIPAKMGVKNYWEFRHKYFYPTSKPGQWLMKRSMQSKFARILDKYCFFMSRKEIGLIDQPRKIRRRVKLPKKIVDMYKTLEAEFLLEYKGKVIDKTIFATQRFIWMRRLTGGIIDGKRYHEEKLKELVRCLRELEDEKIVIWAYFKEEILAIVDYLQQYTTRSITHIDGGVPIKKRKKIIDSFRGDIELLIMETDCGTHGLNLSCADTAIYYSSPLGYEKRRQGQDRIIDIDKKNPPLVIDLICENTVDESLLKANKYKQKRIDIMKTIIDDMKGRN